MQRRSSTPPETHSATDAEWTRCRSAPVAPAQYISGGERSAHDGRPPCSARRAVCLKLATHPRRGTKPIRNAPAAVVKGGPKAPVAGQVASLLWPVVSNYVTWKDIARSVLQQGPGETRRLR